jgi:hypothetical protein
MNISSIADFDAAHYRFVAQRGAVRIGPSSEQVGDLPLGVAPLPTHEPRARLNRLIPPKSFSSAAAIIADDIRKNRTPHFLLI